MYKELGYAKHDGGECIWLVVCDNEDGTVDLSMDDIQGDISVFEVDKRDIILVEKSEYIELIHKLRYEEYGDESKLVSKCI